MRVPERYAERMSPQIAVRLPAQLLDEIDSLVDAGRFETRAEAVRAGIEQLVDDERRRRIGEAIVRGTRASHRPRTLDEELGEFPPPDVDRG